MKKMVLQTIESQLFKTTKHSSKHNMSGLNQYQFISEINCKIKPPRSHPHENHGGRAHVAV